MSNVQRVDHIAIAVRSIEVSRQRFETLYGAEYLGQRENTDQQYIVAYFLLGEDLITMLEGTTPESFVSQHIEKRGEGVQHVGIEVEDLDSFLATLEAGGARVSNQRTLAGVRKEALVSPRSAFGMILQPIEWTGDLRNEPHHERILKAGGI